MNPFLVAVEQFIPIPPLRQPRDPNVCAFCSKRPRVEPYKTCDECRAWAKNTAATRKAQGLCTHNGCPNSPKTGHTLCQEHLNRMLQLCNERRAKRVKAKVCIDCGKRPQWFGQRCVLCRADFALPGSLPLGARRALKKYRRNEEIYDRRRVATKACALLSGRTLQVISYRHGLYDGFDWTLEEIGQKLGVTRERIRQIEARTYDDLSTSGLDIQRLYVPYKQKRRPIPVTVSKYEQKKRKAHNLVANAIRDGAITKQPCIKCGDPDAIAHHHKGYDRPLEVEWLCRHHHMIAHGRNKTGRYTPTNQLKPDQPAAWLNLSPTDNRIIAVLERMKRFRPRLKQKQVIADSGFGYQPLMNALRGFSDDLAVISFLEIYMTQLESEQKAKAA